MEPPSPEAPLRWRYFGCVGRAGHYLFDTRLSWLHAREYRLPWTLEEIDTHPGPACLYSRGVEVEGRAVLTHREGWTALGFPDRSVDHRGGSKSIFFVNRLWWSAEMIASAREAFPSVWARYAFKVG